MAFLFYFYLFLPGGGAPPYEKLEIANGLLRECRIVDVKYLGRYGKTHTVPRATVFIRPPQRIPDCPYATEDSGYQNLYFEIVSHERKATPESICEQINKHANRQVVVKHSKTTWVNEFRNYYSQIAWEITDQNRPIIDYETQKRIWTTDSAGMALMLGFITCLGVILWFLGNRR